MENKNPIYIEKLASKMGEKVAKVSMLLENFVLGLAADLHANETVSFEPFGNFTIKKHVEYIKEEEGRKTIYPPRIEVEFSASAIASALLSGEGAGLVNTYSEMTERCDLDKDGISEFIAQLKSTLKSQLLLNKEAIIPYLGSFEGELGGDLVFTPDTNFAALINKPFSFFQPEVMVEEEELVEEEQEEVASTDTIAAVEILADEEDINLPPPLPIDEPENEEDIPPIPVASEASVIEEDIAGEVTLDTIEVYPDEAEIEPQVESEEETKVESEGNTEVAVEEVPDEPVEEVAEETLEEELNEEKIEVVDTTPPTNSLNLVEFFAYQKLIEDKENQVKFYRRFAYSLLALTFLLIVLVLYLFFSSPLHRQTLEADPIVKPTIAVIDSMPEEREEVLESDTLLTQVEATDTLGLVQEEAIDEQALDLPEYVDKEDVTRVAEPAIPETPEYVLHKLRRGETLRGIALKYYNDKDLWKLIVETNKDVIKDPDVIPVGEVIRIPKKQ